MQVLQALCVFLGLFALLAGWAIGSTPVVAAAVVLMFVALLIEFGGVRSGRFHS